MHPTARPYFLAAFCAALSAACGLFAGYSDFVARVYFTEDVMPAIPLLPASGANRRTARAAAGLALGLDYGLGVFVVHVVGTWLVGHLPPDPPPHNPFAPLVAIVPATLGAYASTALNGVTIRLRA